MRKTTINHLSVVRDFALYFIRKAKKDLKIKRKDYKSANVEYTTRGMIYVWFFLYAGEVKYMTYTADGKRYE